MFRFPILSLLASALIGCNAKPPEPPLQENLGTHHVAISSRNERAQVYFNHGMRLAYALNHEERNAPSRAARAPDARRRPPGPHAGAHYVRVGRYADAAESNVHATHTDAAYLSSDRTRSARPALVGKSAAGRVRISRGATLPAPQAYLQA